MQLSGESDGEKKEFVVMNGSDLDGRFQCEDAHLLLSMSSRKFLVLLIEKTFREVFVFD